MDDSTELRKLAEWYRDFAEVGHTDQRQSRLEFADYLERTAEELEQRAARRRSPPSRPD